jgi:hypothetical protein
MDNSKGGNSKSGGSGNSSTNPTSDKRGDKGNIGGGNNSNNSENRKSSNDNLKENLGLNEIPKSIEIEVVGNQNDVPKPKRKYKPRESKTPNKENENKSIDNTKDIQMLIEGTFAIVALKAGQHWVVSPAESIQIAKPLSNILNKYNLADKVSTVSDPIALLIACGMIVFPRLMIGKMTDEKKQKEVLKNNGAITESKPKQQERNNSNTSGQNTGTSNSTNQPNLYESIVALSNQV